MMNENSVYSEIQQQNTLNHDKKEQNQTKYQTHITFDSHQHQIALQIICKIAKRNYSRHFVKKLMFNYIQSLKKPQPVYNNFVYQTKKVNINWPFRDLYLKKNRTTDEEQLFQFVNLCAQMIQSKFKAYIIRKRHIIAFNKAKRAKDLLSSFIKRWKAYRTYNCQKIVETRKKIKQIQKQIDFQQQKFSNRDAKKLKGLYKYLQMNTKIFKDTFSLLSETGMWTLQKNTKPLIFRQVKKVQKQTKPVRQRQFRASRKAIQKNLTAVSTIQKSQQNNKKQNIDQNISNQFLNIIPNKSAKFSQIQDRPIKAAGQYKINQFEKQQQLPVQKQKAKQIKSEMPQIQQAEQQPNQQKTQQKVRKTKQLQKRIKYDPRKAIQQQKKRKMQQIAQMAQSNAQQPTLQIKPKKQVNKMKVDKTDQNLSSKDIKQQKTSQKNQAKNIKNIKQKKQEQKSKMVKVQPDSSKQIKLKKVSSKVDCWGSKKEAQPDWIKQYKSRILQNKQTQQKIVQDLRKSLQKNIINKSEVKNKNQIKFRQPERAIQENEYRETRLREQAEERQQRRFIKINKAINQSWQSRQKQIENLQQKRDQFVGQRKNSAHNLQQHVRATMERKNIIYKKQTHRPIQQLEQTYTKHYSDRYQNLIPKLGLLAVARSQQRNSQIPIISDQNQQFNQWFQHLYSATLQNSNLYWKVVSQNQRIFKSFIIS